MSHRSAARRRIVLAVLAAVTVAGGLCVHRFGSGDLGDMAGDALYAALVYLVFAFLLPRRARSLCAALAIIVCTVIEFLQLTDVPATLAELFPPAALVLGAHFDRRDLLVYAFAVVCAMLLDVVVSRALRRRAAQQP
ncbi:ribosomal maturation YjgA family protein [Microbacterium aerolatum]|uniref:ribosomal maturation YjgA family protein n=1 Tax=Microbacterium aerolatum TaxID=153731 RepID=UPI001E36E333|nr:DUF2809 domain-containing protein [Microbacterium aerolatum]